MSNETLTISSVIENSVTKLSNSCSTLYMDNLNYINNMTSREIFIFITVYCFWRGLGFYRGYNGFGCFTNAMHATRICKGILYGYMYTHPLTFGISIFNELLTLLGRPASELFPQIINQDLKLN